MTITTIRRAFFRWYEYEAMLKFEKENPAYKKIAEDTTGTTYEWDECGREERRMNNALIYVIIIQLGIIIGLLWSMQ